MNGKRGIGSLLIILIVVAVAIAGWYYYNSTGSSNISGTVTNVVPTQCIANPEIAGWADVEFAKLGTANFAGLNDLCNKRLVSIECNGWDIPGSPLKACVWNVKCGNGVIDAGLEQCEGSDLGGRTCATYGYENGKVTCRNDCKVDMSECY